MQISCSKLNFTMIDNHFNAICIKNGIIELILGLSYIHKTSDVNELAKDSNHAGRMDTLAGNFTL